MAGSGTAHLRDRDDLVLRAEHLVVEFPAGRRHRVHAVSDVSFDVAKGETLGLVGESGCGKSTTGRALIQAPAPTSGSVRLDGVELSTLRGKELRRKRLGLQMVAQDPISSINPRRRIRDVVAEGLSVWEGKGGEDPRVAEVLRAVGIDADRHGGKRAHELSGGQCQRVSIARSLVLDPEVLICDEPVSALDVSVQAQIINLLADMKARYGLTMVFIAHDLAVVKNISDRVAVMYLGKLCEVGPPDDLYREPAHPYTAALLDSIPEPDPDAVNDGAPLGGELPSPLAPPSGCRFRTRCPRSEARCAEEEPLMREVAPGHHVACHFPLIDVAETPVAVGV